MLRFKDNKFSLLSETDLKTNDLLEQNNLQKAIVNSWSDFRKEIQMPELQFIGQEVVPDDRIKNRIDILAFDPEDSVPVVIELKRDKGKFQLLQGISYASMISSWTPERFRSEAKSQKSPDLEEIESALSDDIALEGAVRVVLIAKTFGPEVVITADWLYRQFNMDISAISINLFKTKDELYFKFDQRYPLPELHEAYESRETKKNPSKGNKTWENVARKFSYEWGKELLERCRKEKEGDPSRGRIVTFRSNYDGFKRVALGFKINYVTVSPRGKSENAEEFLRSKFRENIEVNSSRGGYSFRVASQSQYEDLCAWLKIK